MNEETNLNEQTVKAKRKHWEIFGGREVIGHFARKIFCNLILLLSGPSSVHLLSSHSNSFWVSIRTTGYFFGLPLLRWMGAFALCSSSSFSIGSTFKQRFSWLVGLTFKYFLVPTEAETSPRKKIKIQQDFIGKNDLIDLTTLSKNG